MVEKIQTSKMPAMNNNLRWTAAKVFFLCVAAGQADASSLTLAGTVVGIGTRSAAVLMEGGQQYLLYEGEQLGEAVIEKVETDRVTLAAAGRKEVLLLNGGRVEGATSAEAAAPPMLPPDLMPPPPPPAPAPMPEEP